MPKILTINHERLAINLFDIDRTTPEILSQLARRLSLEKTITIDRGKEVAVEFVCNLYSAASLCDIIRDHDRKVGDYPTRIYIFRESVWRRLPDGIGLTTVRNGVVWLNPNVFSSAPDKESAVIRDDDTITRVELKGKVVQAKKGW